VIVTERKPVQPAATNTEPANPPRNGLEVRQERMACQQCGGTHMEVVLGVGDARQYRCVGCGAWVPRPRRR